MAGEAHGFRLVFVGLPVCLVVLSAFVTLGGVFLQKLQCWTPVEFTHGQIVASTAQCSCPTASLWEPSSGVPSDVRRPAPYIRICDGRDLATTLVVHALVVVGLGILWNLVAASFSGTDSAMGRKPLAELLPSDKKKCGDETSSDDPKPKRKRRSNKIVPGAFQLIILASLLIFCAVGASTAYVPHQTRNATTTDITDIKISSNVWATPRKVLCDMLIRKLGNVHQFTLDCAQGSLPDVLKHTVEVTRVLYIGVSVYSAVFIAFCCMRLVVGLIVGSEQ